MNDQPVIDPHSQLREFLAQSDFMRNGGVLTDLDGTALHEENGRVAVSLPMKTGLKRMHDLGRAVVINSLRFPLSVIRTFGKAWYQIAGVPVPVVAMRGSLCGNMVLRPTGEIGFQEIEAVCLEPSDIQQILTSASTLVDAGATELLIFFYPRDWTRGEIIWTPDPGRVQNVGAKYRSASQVISGDVRVLEKALKAEEICMVFRLLDLPQDRAMAYQHTQRSSFFTRPGVDKLYGARRMAQHLGIDLLHSIGAGDTPMDDFLAGVGFAVIVGNMQLEYKGLLHTVRIRDSLALGNLLYAIGELGSKVGAQE
ncbi:MAG: HAD family phosphatase [Burkholderiaceae bacterium]|nr:HAD family phosphatase [Burkholderiaceae bacterium]